MQASGADPIGLIHKNCTEFNRRVTNRYSISRLNTETRKQGRIGSNTKDAVFFIRY